MTLHDDVAPLLTSLWNQGAPLYNPQNPYNALCPETDGQLCVTGCVATALAQVLYYYRWPQEPLTGPVPSYTMANDRVIDELPATSFDWDNMVDDYTQPTTEEQQEAVARLMRYCGQTVQMDYTPYISNSYYYDTDILVNLFSYDQGLNFVYSTNYTIAEWNEMLYNELREGRPMPYVGSSMGGGHAFVIDGYQVKDGTGYYHVNWGWAGEADGFYKINLFNPTSSGTGASSTSDGYNIQQGALIGLQPAKAPLTDYGRYLVSNEWNNVSIDENDIEHHICGAVNTSYKPGLFTLALAERNADGSIDYSQLYDQKDVEIAGFSAAEYPTIGTGKYNFEPLSQPSTLNSQPSTQDITTLQSSTRKAALQPPGGPYTALTAT
ncbi:MAG: C10 family peptidase [Prevotella sp.]|nr:C10 family peptidase [Prevotella sp.]